MKGEPQRDAEHVGRAEQDALGDGEGVPLEGSHGLGLVRAREVAPERVGAVMGTNWPGVAPHCRRVCGWKEQPHVPTLALSVTCLVQAEHDWLP